MHKIAVLIAGPTASGKSSYALARAQQTGGVIINTDSMQVYKDLQLISARPTQKVYNQEAYNEVPHHLYGYIDGSEPYSIGVWLRDVELLLSKCEGQKLYFVGGTGLYFDALLDGFARIPDVPAGLVAQIEKEIASLNEAARRALLQREDPTFLARLNVADPQRTIRALAVKRHTGYSLSDFQKKAKAHSVLADYKVEKKILMPPRELLYQRINKRVDQMLVNGALDEVKALMARALPENASVLKAIGVPELGACLKGEMDLGAAKALMAQHTRNYAKRQMTWFRNRFGDWEHIDPKQG